MFRFPVIQFFKPRQKPAQPKPVQSQPVHYQTPVVKYLLSIGEVIGTEANKPFYIDAREWEDDGDRDVILASSGFGKSYLAGVISEEVIESGGLLFIIDPEGENHTLAAYYNKLAKKDENAPTIWIVGGQHKTVTLDLDEATQADIDEIVETVLTLGVSIIWDLSGRTQKNQQELFARIAGSLFSAQDSEELRRPVKFIVEEARVFAPQKATGLTKVDGETCLSVFENIATRGRKRGINMLLATQRCASVNKDIISQANRWWFGGVKSTQDCDALMPYLEQAEVTIEDKDIKALQAGEFFYCGKGQPIKIQTRKRKSKHGGKTPSVKSSNIKRASRADAEAALKRLNGQA